VSKYKSIKINKKIKNQISMENVKSKLFLDKYYLWESISLGAYARIYMFSLIIYSHMNLFVSYYKII